MSFYLQDSRSYVGNDVLWWARGGKGYTSDLRLAQVYTKDAALRQNQARATDIPWPCDYVQCWIRPVVDMQYLDPSEALAGTGIVLCKPEATPKPERYKCEGCGVFMSDAGRYGSPCAKCGKDNRP